MDDIVTRLRAMADQFRWMDLESARTNTAEAAAEIERLRVAGDALARYMAMEHYPEDCEDECESLAAWRAWQEARRG